ncbi:GTP cyclohydrolase FolE2 [Halomonas sp. SCS19]|uniref:GTP cyclohydrolase FolE2 n=1 Tax=Halomonas sp. SCS19 TaxID=2950870 RepID=UPI0032DE57F6
MNDAQIEASQAVNDTVSDTVNDTVSDTDARGREPIDDPQRLSDVAVQQVSQGVALDWVGMEGIALPVELAGQRIEARVNAGVSLDAPEARGIHMSRLYLALDDLTEEALTLPRLDACLARFLDRHEGLSRSASLSLEGRLLLKRPALVSDLAGWKAYPFHLEVEQRGGQRSVVLRLEVGYSSTCPCSAALARQLIQQQFNRDFAAEPHPARDEVHRWLGQESGIVATPHSQRSQVIMALRLGLEVEDVPMVEVIDRVEQSLGTALQTAVKRPDEQAFALANGQNLMFCEDAARRVHGCLMTIPGIDGFEQKVIHAESLHAHDAVARSSWRW